MSHADEGLVWAWSGFGTAGAVVTNTDGAQYRSSSRQSRGADKSPDAGVDSRLGLQANLNVGDTFSAVGQVLVSRGVDGMRPQLEWLFGQASVTPWLDLKAGRMVLPVFLVSDSRNVGYAAHWVRAPNEVYSLFPLTSFDGGQAQIRTDWAGTHFTLQASGGRSTVDIYGYGSKITVDVKKAYALNLLAERGDWTFRLGGVTTPDAKLKGLPVALPPVTDNFLGVGVIYDNGSQLVQGEYVIRRQGDGGAFDSDSYYVTAGQRWGAWMPYATYSRFVPKGDVLFVGSDRLATVAAGVRWDAFRGVAIKAQVESADVSATSFVNVSPALAGRRAKVTVFTLLADFVF